MRILFNKKKNNDNFGVVIYKEGKISMVSLLMMKSEI